MIKIIKQTLYTQFVDDSTGEIFEDTREFLDESIKPKRKTSTRSKKESNSDPVAKIMLLENKLQLNKAAVDLTGFEPDNKYDVRFEKKGKQITPVICWDENKGNRLTKTYTISFRGSRHDNLIEFGDVFELIPYEGHEGWFKLKGNAPEKEDDIIDVPDEISVEDEESEDIAEGVEAADIDFDLDI